jgi:hypothetical protein
MATRPGKRSKQEQASPATAGQHPEVTRSDVPVVITGEYRQTPEAEWHACQCHIWEHFNVMKPDHKGDLHVVDVMTACAYCGGPRCDSHDLESSTECSDSNRCVWERHHQCAPRHRGHEFPSGRVREVGK